MIVFALKIKGNHIIYDRAAFLYSLNLYKYTNYIK